jgi:glycosyltransferase involved in cell wall biosynthesis
MSRLLYVGYAFPPGWQALHPDVNPAGHGFETQMIAALRGHFEIRSAGLLPVPTPAPAPDPGASPGVTHDLLLFEGPPELLSRHRAFTALKRRYLQWRSAGWMPEAVLFYNLGPVYNAFARWLRRQTPRPRLVLLLLDSSQLGKPLPALKRLRYRFKPYTVPDADMLPCFDSCIGLSTDVETYFQPRGVPFLWMPGACNPTPLPDAADMLPPANTPIRFGYFGALAAHAGVADLAEVIRQSSTPATLRICGYGKFSAQLAEIGKTDPRIQFEGFLAKPEDCLGFGRGCDALVNPRPPSHGNQNNFPSKLFNYARCGRAILSSRISGVDRVLGPEAFYYDTARHPASLREAMESIVRLDRAELRRRGAAIRERVRTEFNWPKQAERMATFIRQK